VALPFVSEVTDFHVRKAGGKYASPKENPAELQRGKPEDDSGFYGWSKLQIEQLGVERMHQDGYTGKDVVIAIIDCGFNLKHSAFNHPEHKLNVVSQWDFMDNDSIVSPEEKDPPAQHYHGTFVLGLIAAYAPEMLVGTAYDAGFILCKAESDAEEFLLEEKWFVAALEYAERMGADVISSSCGLYEFYSFSQMDGKTSVMSQGWKLAVENGILGFQGVGNYGHDQDPSTNRIFPPGDAIGIISCGAVMPDGSIARFSSDGPTVDGRQKPELLALGAGVWTVAAADHTGIIQSAGTSMATPLLAGAGACLLQLHPDWTVEQVQQALFRSGDYFRREGKPDPLHIHGYGIPDVSRAAGLIR
jgi:subtilisin family serine protease